ncbi:MAG: DUF4838 domain-containing protein [Armatimonadota bacterium]|nr:DUF4838 domain-containing protein [Armatimonadota bacterium]
MVIFDDSQQSGCAICLAPGASAPERFAAEELRRYLSAATSGNFPILDSLAPDQIGFLVGDLGRSLVEPLPDLSEDGYVMRRVGDQIVLLGGSPRATLYAVYHFLERYLGFRWLEPGDDAVPSLSKISLENLDDLEEPAYTFRSVVNFPFTVERMLKESDWMAKNRLNWTHPGINHPHVWAECRGAETVMPDITKRGLRMLWGGHTFQTWIPTDVYFETNPEFFGLVNGERIPQQNFRGSLCLSNPQLQREVAKNILRFAAENPDIDIVDIWMNDTVDWCECENCEKTDGDPDYIQHPEIFSLEGKPQKSRAYFTFVNNVARMVGKENPNLRLSPLAYARTFEPPTNLKVESNVIVGYTNFTRSTINSLLDDSLADEGSKLNVIYVETIRRWQNHADPENLFIYEYYDYPDTFNPFSELRTNVVQMAEELKWYPKVGILQMSSEGAGEFYWRPMVMYVYAHLVWNPEQSYEDLMKDFCDHAYGDVAGQMLKFWKIQELRHPHITQRDKNLKILEEIKGMTGDPTVIARLEHLEELVSRPDHITKWPDESEQPKDQGPGGLVGFADAS